jgi:hypothetical protein
MYNTLFAWALNCLYPAVVAKNARAKSFWLLGICVFWAELAAAAAFGMQ